MWIIYSDSVIRKNYQALNKNSHSWKDQSILGNYIPDPNFKSNPHKKRRDGNKKSESLPILLYENNIIQRTNNSQNNKNHLAAIAEGKNDIYFDSLIPYYIIINNNKKNIWTQLLCQGIILAWS